MPVSETNSSADSSEVVKPCMDNREKGYTLFKKGLKYKDISKELGVPESTVKSWAARYWKKEKDATKKVAEKSKKVATKDATKPPGKKSGGQPGNVNAVGNKGGSAPVGNQNAFKHGGYAAILFDTLDEDEHSLIDQMEPNEEQMLIDEINLLTIRERRILQRIQEAQKAPLGVSGSVRTETKRVFDSKEDEKLYNERIREKIEAKERLPGREYSMHTTTEASYSIILKLEEALTRCQAQKQKAIDSLNRIRQAQGSKGGALADDWISAVIDTMGGTDDGED